MVSVLRTSALKILGTTFETCDGRPFFTLGKRGRGGFYESLQVCGGECYSGEPWMSITAEYDMRFTLAVTSLSDLESFENRYFYIMYLLLHCV